MKFHRITALILTALLPTLAASLISQNVNGAFWEGKVRVDRDYKKVTVHETYLEIEEEVELSAEEGWRGAPPEASQSSLEISGHFALPNKAVLIGAVLWEGNQILKANLKTRVAASNEYTDSVDHNWEWVPSPTDPMLIAMSKRATSIEEDDSYEFKLFPVVWGMTRRLRIRYLLPVRTESGVPKLSIPQVFVDAVGGFGNEIPQNYTLELKGAPGVESVKLRDDSNTFPYQLSSSPLTLIQEYRNGSHLKIDLDDFDTAGVMLSTIIDDGGVLDGEYLHYYSTVPNELFVDAGLKREVVFLWRWENENSFVEWYDQTKYLSNFGKKALSQAKNIRGAAVSLLNAKAGVGMVVDRSEGSEDTLFHIGHEGNAEADSLLDYLNYLSSSNGDALLAEISGYEVTNEHDDGDTLTAEQLDSISLVGNDEFQIVVDSIKTLFSVDENVVQHVVVITVGKRKTDNNIVYTDSIKGLNGVTFSCYGTDSKYADGYWPGVDMRNIASRRRLIDGNPLNGYYCPKAIDVNFKLSLKSAQASKAFVITGKSDGDATYYDRVSFTGHAAESWNDTVIWQAYDTDGNELASVIQTPEITSTVNDTNLIMLWGGSSSSPYSETMKSGSIGYLVGFVDESYSLLAMPYDTVSQEVEDALENGGDIENLKEDEIFGPTAIVTDITSVASSGFYSAISTSMGVKFELNIGTARNATLYIFDLRGRLVMQFTQDQLTGQSSIMWDGTSISGGSVGTGMFVAHLSMDGYAKSIKFIR